MDVDGCRHVDGRRRLRKEQWSMSTEKSAVVNIDGIFHDLLYNKVPSTSTEKSAGCTFLLVNVDSRRQPLHFSRRLQAALFITPYKKLKKTLASQNFDSNENI